MQDLVSWLQLWVMLTWDVFWKDWRQAEDGERGRREVERNQCGEALIQTELFWAEHLVHSTAAEMDVLPANITNTERTSRRFSQVTCWQDVRAVVLNETSQFTVKEQFTQSQIQSEAGCWVRAWIGLDWPKGARWALAEVYTLVLSSVL